MRIGFFTDTFYPSVNGVAKSIESFGQELHKRGHELHVFCPRTDKKWYKGMRVHSRPSVRFLPYPEFSLAAPFGRVPKLDIAHTHGPFSAGLSGLWTARRQGIPAVSTFHTPLQHYVGYISKRHEGTLAKIAEAYAINHYRRYDALITPSLAIKKMIKSAGVETFIVPTGIDTKFYRPGNKQTARRRLGIDAERVFLCLGRLSPEKNIDKIIKAAKNFIGPEDVLLIVGKGPDSERLKDAAVMSGAGERIQFRGFVPDGDVPLYYSASDAFIMASTAETQGIVMLEAMSCGCPVIGADALAIPEIIRDRKNGRLFNPGDVNALARAAKGFRPEKKMVKEAIKTASSYSIKKCTDKLEEVYDRLVVRP
jgi:1,2-diacylglycerol 3-alpha-glucosyltransferase